MSKKVITFGELMLRLAPEGYYRFVQADKLGATFGGGEANVAVSLANYGFDARFVSISKSLPTTSSSLINPSFSLSLTYHSIKELPSIKEPSLLRALFLVELLFLFELFSSYYICNHINYK